MFQKMMLWLHKEKSYVDYWFEIDERWRYLTVAVTNVLLKYLLFALLSLVYSDNYQFNLFLSWIFSSFSAFVGYKFLVFTTTGKHLAEYLKSLAILGWSYMLNSLFLWFLVNKAMWNPYLSQALILVFLTSCNFWLFKHFAFKEKSPQRNFWEKVYAVFD